VLEPTTRAERKERTRRQILDAALELSAGSTFAALSLRQVAREVGIVPTAFYRHFDSVEALGLELVEESFASLRSMMRDIRQGDPSLADVVDRSVSILVDHVHQRRDHFLFIARERTAGPPAVREAIREQIEAFERELTADLARLPGAGGWSAADLAVLSDLIVNAMVATTESVLAAAGDPEVEAASVERARTQLRMVLVGALNWRSRA
jgi:AcrR family transcriptional regulator